MYRLKVEKLSKRFGPRKVFSKIDFTVSEGESLAVIGHNGSGKSTLLKVLLSLFRPSRGTIEYLNDDTLLTESEIRAEVSFVSPYLNLYDNLTAEENLRFFTQVAGGHVTGKEIDQLLERVGLQGRGMDEVGGYSSGMKQRLKYAVALMKNPRFLYLDEPTSNLDDAGKKIVFDIIEQYRKNAVIIIATNEKEEYDLAQTHCRLGG